MAAVDHGITISAFVSRTRVLVRESATCISAVSPLRSTVVHERETWALPAHLLRFSSAMRCSGECFNGKRRDFSTYQWETDTVQEEDAALCSVQEALSKKACSAKPF